MGTLFDKSTHVRSSIYLLHRYEVLKSHIKESNEDLYTELTSREGVKVIDKKLDQSAKVREIGLTNRQRFLNMSRPISQY